MSKKKNEDSLFVKNFKGGREPILRAEVSPCDLWKNSDHQEYLSVYHKQRQYVQLLLSSDIIILENRMDG